jgi:SAM-dependent methyltransferase
MTTTERNEAEIRNQVRQRYAGVAKAGGMSTGSCCGPSKEKIAARLGYTADDLAAVPGSANLGVGCGAPVAHANLRPGDTVLDLGSGAGFDAFLAAREVGDAGRVIGVDMTPEMLERARRNAVSGGYTNVEFREGVIEKLPLADASVDVVISNCVINLAPDKRAVFREAARVLRPGGRMVVSDIVLDAPLPAAIASSVAAWTGCVAGASLRTDYLAAIREAGLEDVEVVKELGFGEMATSMAPAELLDVACKAGIDVGAVAATVRSIKVRAVKRTRGDEDTAMRRNLILRDASRGQEIRVVELDHIPEGVLACVASPSRTPDRVVLAPGFLRAYFAAPPPGVKPGLLLASRTDGTPAGISVFARFGVHLDCLAPMPVQRVAATVRRWWPKFLEMRVLMFGIPAGVGTFDTLLLTRGDSEAGRCTREALVRASLALMKREHATGAIWKELDRELLAEWQPLLDARGFVCEPSVPTVAQVVEVSTLADYEAKLRARYRRQLRANVERASASGLEIRLAQPFAAWAERWHPLFLQVLAHSSTRLETLGAEFFRELARDPMYVLNTAVLDGRLVGGALCTIDRGKLHFLYIGMDYSAARDCDLYFNLLHSVLRLAIERGCREIHWGQTSLDAKGRFGGAAHPLWFFFKFRHAWLNRALRSIGPILFPERRQTERRVLRSTEPPAAALVHTTRAQDVAHTPAV